MNNEKISPAEDIVSSPTQQLKERWVQLNEGTEQQEGSNPQIANWIGDFYDYYFRTDPSHLDQELKIIAIDALEIVKSTDEQAVERIQKELKDTRFSDRGPILGRISEYVKPIISKYKTSKSFELILDKLQSDQANANTIPLQEAESFSQEEQSRKRIEEAVEQADLSFLSGDSRERIEEIQEMGVSSEDLIDELIDFEVARDNKQAVMLVNAYDAAQAELKDALGKMNAQQIGGVLSRHQGILRVLNRGILPDILNHLPKLSRMSSREWQSTKPQLETETFNLLSPKNMRDTVISNLIANKILDPDVIKKINSTLGIRNCCERLFQLEILLKENNITYEEEKRAVLLHGLADLKEQGAPSIIIEDIVNGNLTSEDLAVYQLLDWLNIETEIPTTQIARAEMDSRLMDLLEKIKNGAAIAALLPLMPLAIAAGLMGKFAPPIAKDILQGFEGGGTGWEKSSSSVFEGVEFEPHIKEWDVDIPLVKGQTYFRVRSSDRFDLSKGEWTGERDMLPVFETDPNRYKVQVHLEIKFGNIKNKRVNEDTEFYYFPVPFGKCFSRIVNYEETPSQLFSIQQDGSVGIFWKQRDSALKHKGKNLSAKHGVQIFFSETAQTPTQLYPMDKTQALDPLILDSDALPQETKTFLLRLESQRLSKELEAMSIFDFVRDTFIYSIDPANNKRFKDALNAGPNKFINHLFTDKRVKCDGAATAAIALLRLRSIPSRLAEGYLYDQNDPKKSDGLYSDSRHGWVEYWTGSELKMGDPTPGNMDEITKKIKAKSKFINKFLGLFKGEDKYTQERYFEECGRNLAAIARIFNNICVNNRAYDYLRYPSYFPKKKQREALELKMETDADNLREIAKEQETSLLTSDEVISKIADRGIETEVNIRERMLKDNFSDMGMPALGHFLESAYGPEGLSFDNEFMSNYSKNHFIKDVYLNTYVNSEGYPVRYGGGDTGRLFFNVVDYYVQEYLIRIYEKDGSSFQKRPLAERDLLKVLTEELEKGVFLNLNKMIDSKKDKDLKEAVQRQIEKNKGKITPEALRKSPLFALCRSYLACVGKLRDLDITII